MPLLERATRTRPQLQPEKKRVRVLRGAQIYQTTYLLPLGYEKVRAVSVHTESKETRGSDGEGIKKKTPRVLDPKEGEIRARMAPARPILCSRALDGFRGACRPDGGDGTQAATPPYNPPKAGQSLASGETWVPLGYKRRRAEPDPNEMREREVDDNVRRGADSLPPASPDADLLLSPDVFLWPSSPQGELLIRSLLLLLLLLLVQQACMHID